MRDPYPPTKYVILIFDCLFKREFYNNKLYKEYDLIIFLKALRESFLASEVVQPLGESGSVALIYFFPFPLLYRLKNRHSELPKKLNVISKAKTKRYYFTWNDSIEEQLYIKTSKMMSLRLIESHPSFK